MKESLAAVCGLYCGACALYRARRDNNPQRLEEILKVWKMPENEVNATDALVGARLHPIAGIVRYGTALKTGPGLPNVPTVQISPATGSLILTTTACVTMLMFWKISTICEKLGLKNGLLNRRNDGAVPDAVLKCTGTSAPVIHAGLHNPIVCPN